MEQEQEIRRVLQETLEQYARQIQEEREPALKAELVEERRRREQLERRLNEVVAENGKHRQAAEETERHVAIKGVLQNLGVKKIEVAFRAVRDDVYRGEDGQLYGRGDGGSVGMKEFLARFVADNPEFLPARMAGDERGGERTGAAGDRAPGGYGFRRLAVTNKKEQNKNGSYYVSKRRASDRETGGGRSLAGAGGEPGDGKPGEPQL